MRDERTLELVRALANGLALEFALVEGEDLPSIFEGADVLRSARDWIEEQGGQPVKAVDSILRLYDSHTGPNRLSD